MTARAEYLTRPRKPGITGLLLVGAALGMTGCAQQKTEGYYDPPVESTVTDAQAQGSGANLLQVDGAQIINLWSREHEIFPLIENI
ncbi:hypothetical protein AD428_12010 [Achromobacter sp. DMS1]|nr:hypothetical protein [Achromobacter sp. DMS1]KOF53670.1 hypothetical protein AD428_12010 [Achromobacter sp. DMS1]